jgi:hypothetical protein
MSDSAPALFARVPRGLFGPLGGPYAELYWDLLAELYRCEFEREPFIVVRSAAIGAAESIICASRLWQERREELEAFANEAAPAGPSARVLKRAAVGAWSDPENAERKSAGADGLRPTSDSRGRMRRSRTRRQSARWHGGSCRVWKRPAGCTSSTAPARVRS